MIGRRSGPSTSGTRRLAFPSKWLLPALLAGTCLSPVMGALPVRAQTVWRSTPDSGVFVQGTNWSAGAPTSVTPGAFNTSTITNLNFADAIVSSLIFNSGASAFTFTLTNATAEITGAGVVNNAASHPTFVLNGNTIGGNLTLDSGTFANSTVTLNGFSSLTLGASGGSAAPTLGTANVTSSGLISLNGLGHGRQCRDYQQRAGVGNDRLQRFEHGRQRHHHQQRRHVLPGAVDRRQRQHHQHWVRDLCRKIRQPAAP